MVLLSFSSTSIGYFSLTFVYPHGSSFFSLPERVQIFIKREGAIVGISSNLKLKSVLQIVNGRLDEGG